MTQVVGSKQKCISLATFGGVGKERNVMMEVFE